MFIQTICPPLCGNPSQPLIPLVPTLQSITPTTLPVGSALTAMTVKGTNFTPQTVVTVDGQDRLTNFVDDTTLTGHLLPSADGTPRTVQVGVRNGALVATPTLPFIYTATTLHIASIDPTELPIGGASTTVTATGTGFINNTQILANGSPAYQVQYINPTTVRFVVKPPSTPDQQTITVRNGAVNGTGNPTLTFVDPNAAITPVLTALTPAAFPIGSPIATVEAEGTGFTTFVDDTTLRFDVNPSIVLATQTAQVQVRNGSALSNSLPLDYTAANLSITAATPNTGVITDPSTPITTTITGTGFLPSTQIFVDGEAPGTPTYVSPTSMTVLIVPFGAARTVQLTVKNGLVSGTGSIPFTYTAPA
jgi:hypothetical protein